MEVIKYGTVVGPIIFKGERFSNKGNLNFWTTKDLLTTDEAWVWALSIPPNVAWDIDQNVMRIIKNEGGIVSNSSKC